MVALVRKLLSRIFICSLCIGAVIQAMQIEKKADLQYELSWRGGGGIHVKLNYLPVKADSTLFVYGEPRFGGQKDIFKGIRNITVHAPASVRIDENSRKIIIYHKSDPIVIEYDILDTRSSNPTVTSELFRPMIEKDYLYCHGVNLFLTPEIKESGRNLIQSVCWKKRPDFPIFNMFDPSNNGERTSFGSPESFLFTIITGDKEQTVDSVLINGVENYVVSVFPKKKEFNRKSLCGFFSKYYCAISRFWGEEKKIPYTLLVHPFKQLEHPAGGMGLGNGFCSKYSSKADTMLDENRLYNFSHEIGHNWIGAESDRQWFGEGFNDYQTFYLLVAAGFMDITSFEKKFNDVLSHLYQSPVREMPNDSIWANYWKMGDYNKLPYWRGQVFAFYLVNQIEKASKGKQGFRDLMLEWRDFSKGSPDSLSRNNFIKIASRFVDGKKLEEDFDKYIVQGKTIPFTKDMLVPECNVKIVNGVPIIEITDKARFAKRFRLANSAAAVFNGKEVSYSAVVKESFLPGGNGVSEGASIITISYVADYDTSSKRPVMFIFNGGPGAASGMLNFSAIGPKRMVKKKDAASFIDNTFSPISEADMVFIDPPGTGLTRWNDTLTSKKYWGVEEDGRLTAEVIKTWLKENNRMDAPVFICGESYGTIRAAEILGIDAGLSLAGTMLFSSCISMGYTSDLGDNANYIFPFPGMAVAAQYHKKGSMNDKSTEDLFNEASLFALDEYRAALEKGEKITKTLKQKIAKKISSFIGLSEKTILDKKLRILPEEYQDLLLAEENAKIGLLDGRVKAQIRKNDSLYFDPALSSKPIDTKNDQLKNNTLRDYYARDLGFANNQEYAAINFFTNYNWKYPESAKERIWPVVHNLKYAMDKYPEMKLLVTGGYYDLATPLFTNSYILSKIGLSQDRITYSYFKAGHSVFEDEDNLKKFNQSICNFIKSSVRK